MPAGQPAPAVLLFSGLRICKKARKVKHYHALRQKTPPGKNGQPKQVVMKIKRCADPAPPAHRGMPGVDPCILDDPAVNLELRLTWERWAGLFSLRRFSLQGREYLLAWFDQSVEDEVDREFKRSPSLGYAKHCLATSALLEQTARFDPQAEKRQCAMVPKQNPAIEEKVKSLGLALNGDGTPKRRFAVFTLRQKENENSCAACRLSDSCRSANLGKTARS